MKQELSHEEIIAICNKRSKRNAISDRITEVIDDAWEYAIDKLGGEYDEACDVMASLIEAKKGIFILISTEKEEIKRDKFWDQGKFVADAHYLNDFDGDYVNLILFDQDPGEDWDLVSEVKEN